jgi:DNA-binding NarL/FixJ family response regulator
MIRIILAEDHKIVRDGIKKLLDQEQDFQIVGDAVNGLEVTQLLDQGVEANIILVDMNAPEIPGPDIIKKIKDNARGAKVVVLTMLDDEKHVLEAFKAGANGYILKNAGSDELIFAIRHINGNGRYVCSELALRFLDRLIHQQNTLFTNVEPTKREAEVLQMIAEGMTNQEIADKLFTSKRTIEGHRQNLLDKTGSRNTAALIKFAILKGMIN